MNIIFNKKRMKILPVLAIVFLSILLQFGCSSVSNLSFANKAENNILNCPSENFSEFLIVFSNDEKFQHEFLKIPLEIQKIDLNSDSEPIPVLNILNAEQIVYPLIPLELERKKKSLDLRVDELTRLKAKVTLYKKDTGYQISYFFNKDFCWRLERIEDWSI